MPTILVTGGSGYLGSHLVAFLAGGGRPGGAGGGGHADEGAAGDGGGAGSGSGGPHWTVGYTYHSNGVPKGLPAFGAARGFRVDLATGEGLAEAMQALGTVDVVVNTAAISQPAQCERDYERAAALNVPTKLVEALEAQRAATGVDALLIHLSTDQVYDGSRPWWSEDDACAPVNAYGRSKLEAEALLRARWPRHVILRASLIFGPEPPFPVGRPLFVQFVERALREGKPTTFFSDEFRCPVYVFDICHLIRHLAALLPAAPPHSVYNLGGPERMSRVDMAEAVARLKGYPRDAIVPVPSAAAGDRGYVSPPDISIKVGRLRADAPSVRLTPFAEALAAIFP